MGFLISLCLLSSPLFFLFGPWQHSRCVFCRGPALPVRHWGKSQDAKRCLNQRHSFFFEPVGILTTRSNIRATHHYQLCRVRPSLGSDRLSEPGGGNNNNNISLPLNLLCLRGQVITPLQTAMSTRTESIARTSHARKRTTQLFESTVTTHTARRERSSLRHSGQHG